MLELYECARSTASQRVRMVLAEKKLSYDSKLLNLDGDQFSAEYLKINPAGTVPVLKHDGHSLVEATVIMHYLNDSFPEIDLMPQSPLRRSRIHTLSKIIDEHVHVACRTLAIATVLRQSTLDNKDSWNKAPTQFGEGAKFRKSVAEAGLSAPQIPNAVRQIGSLLDRAGRYLAKSPYLAGDALTLADTTVYPYVHRLRDLKLDGMWRDRAEIAGWMERIEAREPYAVAFGSPKGEAFPNYKDDPWPVVRGMMSAA